MNTPTLTTCCRRASEALCPKRTQPPSLPPVFEKALTTATCVCRPLVKGFPFLTSTAICFTSRGCKQPIQSCTNEDTGCVLVISIWDAKSTYLQSSSHAVTPLFHGLIPWSLHDRPQNLFPPQTCSHTDCQSANIVQPYSSCRLFSPCRSITFLPNVGIEIPEYNCQSVCCFDVFLLFVFVC